MQEWPPSGTVCTGVRMGTNVLDDNFFGVDAVDVEVEGGGRVRLVRVGEQFQVVGTEELVDSPDYVLVEHADKSYVATLFARAPGEARNTSEPPNAVPAGTYMVCDPPPIPAEASSNPPLPPTAKKPKKSKA